MEIKETKDKFDNQLLIGDTVKIDGGDNLTSFVIRDININITPNELFLKYWSKDDGVWMPANKFFWVSSPRPPRDLE